jgi:hypothetical protein
MQFIKIIHTQLKNWNKKFGSSDQRQWTNSSCSCVEFPRSAAEDHVHWWCKYWSCD